jgi:hypothetical protein
MSGREKIVRRLKASAVDVVLVRQVKIARLLHALFKKIAKSTQPLTALARLVGGTLDAQAARSH